MRTAARKDVNHDELCLFFAGQGCSVQSLHRLGDDVPDLLIGVPGSPALNLLAEIKRGDDGPAHAALTPGQKEWHEAWRGQVATLHSIEEAAELLKAARAYQGEAGP